MSRAGRSGADALRQVPLFADLDRKSLQRVAEALSERTFAAGETIAEQGVMGVGFFVVRDGRAKVSVDGREVAQLGPGDHLGEIALVADTPRTATVVAETDLHCYGMTSWDFRRLVETNSEIAWKLLASTAKKLYEQTR